jgi:hypothetical protein
MERLPLSVIKKPFTVHSLDSFQPMELHNRSVGRAYPSLRSLAAIPNSVLPLHLCVLREIFLFFPLSTGISVNGEQ